MDVAICSTGPAASAARSALDGTDLVVEQTASVADADCAVAIAPAGDEALRDIDRRCREHGVPWVAVELGGIAGRGVCSFAITGFDGSPCYRCLERRVAATTDPVPVEAISEPLAHQAGATAARMVYDLLTGADDPAGRVLESPHAERRLLAVPGCDCLAGSSPDPDRSLSVFDRVAIGRDSRVGIVTTAGELETEPLPYYLAELADPSGFLERPPRLQAAGVAPDWQAASIAAHGEAYERYAAAAATPADPAAVPETAIDPAAFVAPADPETAGWYPARRLADDASVAVPADRVLSPAPEGTTGTTTGLAVGADRADAIRRGLLEVIERDACMLAWYSTADPLGLEIDDGRFQRLVDRVSELSVTPLLCTQDVDVPVVAVAVHREEWPRFAIASAAALDPVAAARDALREAVQNWMELARIGRDEAAGGHVRYADRPPAVEALLDPEQTVSTAGLGPDPVPEGKAAVDLLVERCRAVGLDPLVAELTPPDVAELGLEAVRAVVPAAQPWADADVPFGDRAREVPATMGFDPRLDRDRHPFP